MTMRTSKNAFGCAQTGQTSGALGLLPLAEREVRLGGVRHALLPVIILAVAMALVATGVVPVAGGFFGAAVLVVATGALRMREAYAALEAPVLVLVAALVLHLLLSAAEWKNGAPAYTESDWAELSFDDEERKCDESYCSRSTAMGKDPYSLWGRLQRCLFVVTHILRGDKRRNVQSGGTG